MSPTARWLALGDSYTIGEGVAAHERWPERVAARLTNAGTPVEVVRTVAVTGWTCDELLAGMEAAGVWPAHERFDLVSLLVGVNDQYRGRTPEQGAAAFAECLERALALAGGDAARVLWVSIPDWGVTPFAEGRDRAAIARAIDAWNAHEHARATARGCFTGDVTALSRSHGAEARFLAADGLHPGAAAYEAWAEALTPLAARALAAGA